MLALAGAIGLVAVRPALTQQPMAPAGHGSVWHPDSAAPARPGASEAAGEYVPTVPAPVGGFVAAALPDGKARSLDGDTCATAIVIPSVPFSVVGSTCGHQHDYDQVCPWSGSTAPDVVYAYTPAVDEAITVSLCHELTDYDSKIYVYEDVCAGVPIGCNDDACATLSYPDHAYVSRLGSMWLTGGHTYYFVVDGYGSECGTYQLEVAPGPPPICLPEAHYGQATHPPGGSLEAATSTPPFRVYDNFSGVPSAIDGVNWWGLSLICCWSACQPWEMVFDVTFYEDVAGYPGRAVCSYSVTPQITATGSDYGGFESYHFFADGLQPPCYLPAGWISIQSHSLPDGCGFLWLSSPEGDGYSWQLADGLQPLVFDRAFCLFGDGEPVFGACCDEAAGTCADNVAMSACAPPRRFLPNGTCAELNPPCGAATGACCRPDGTCQVTAAAACTDLWLGAGTTCDLCPCVVPCAPDEGEPACHDGYIDTYNGGCNSTPSVFQPIVCGETVCGQSGTYQTGTAQMRDTDWYEFVRSSGGAYRFDVEAEFPVRILIIDGNQGCSDFNYWSAQGGACTPISVTTPCLPPGRYWFWVAPTSFEPEVPCGSRYIATLTCVSQTPDFSVEAPGAWSGSTCGAGDDSTLRPSLDQSFLVVIPTEGTWVFDTCAASWDTYLYLGTQCSSGDIASDDDGCGTQSRIEADLSPGAYWLTVEGDGQNDCGPYTLNVYRRACVVDCPAGAVLEGEPACSNEYVDMYNGGCDGSTPVFQTIACGQAICGEAGTFERDGAAARDSDWYELVATEERTYTWAVEAEFDVLVSIVQTLTSACGDQSTIVSSTVPACTPAGFTTHCLPAGRYWLQLRPAAFVGVPCGARYTVSVECAPCDLTYCPAWGGCGSFVSGVDFANVSTAGVTCSPDGYEFHAANCAVLRRDRPYDISIVNGNPSAGDRCATWVDWNRDGVFDPLSESLSLAGTPGPGPYTATFNVPAGVSLGESRLRIRLTGSSGSVPTCGPKSVGEVEDYGILVAGIAGDVDGDGDVDAIDFATLADCLAGPDVSMLPFGCDPDDFAKSDLDDDHDVDLADFALFQREFTGGE